MAKKSLGEFYRRERPSCRWRRTRRKKKKGRRRRRRDERKETGVNAEAEVSRDGDRWKRGASGRGVR